jgi:hypothetical protein
MINAIPKQCIALLKETSEMFEETGCVPERAGGRLGWNVMALNRRVFRIAH